MSRPSAIHPEFFWLGGDCASSGGREQTAASRPSRVGFAACFPVIRAAEARFCFALAESRMFCILTSQYHDDPWASMYATQVCRSRHNAPSHSLFSFRQTVPHVLQMQAALHAFTISCVLPSCHYPVTAHFLCTNWSLPDIPPSVVACMGNPADACLIF